MKLEGKKLEMSQVFKEDGTVIPVTAVVLNEGLSGELVGKEVVVVGWSKGAGFAGHMKRHGFKGGKATHGQSDRARAPGSSGATTTPGRVLKGTRRAGRLGGRKVTLKGLMIVEADKDSKRVMISGPLPGARNSKIIVEIKEG